MTTEVAQKVIGGLKGQYSSTGGAQGQMNPGIYGRAIGDFYAKEIWDVVKRNLGLAISQWLQLAAWLAGAELCFDVWWDKAGLNRWSEKTRPPRY
jgi:hypothetical protein